MGTEAYTDSFLRRILDESQIVANVGISIKEERPSFRCMRDLQGFGYRVIPINPGLAGREILGERVYASLADIPADIGPANIGPAAIDIVQVFRNSSMVGPVADAAIAIGAKTLWMQLGVRDEAAAKRARAAGLNVVMDRCVNRERRRLFETPRAAPNT